MFPWVEWSNPVAWVLAEVLLKILSTQPWVLSSALLWIYPPPNALKLVSEGPTLCPLWGILTKHGALTILRSSKTLCNKQANIQCLASKLIFQAHKGTGKWDDNGEESTKDWNSLRYDNCGLFYLPTAHQRQQNDARAVFQSLPSSYLSS